MSLLPSLGAQHTVAALQSRSQRPQKQQPHSSRSELSGHSGSLSPAGISTVLQMLMASEPGVSSSWHGGSKGMGSRLAPARQLSAGDVVKAAAEGGASPGHSGQLLSDRHRMAVASVIAVRNIVGNSRASRSAAAQHRTQGHGRSGPQLRSLLPEGERHMQP